MGPMTEVEIFRAAHFSWQCKRASVGNGQEVRRDGPHAGSDSATTASGSVWESVVMGQDVKLVGSLSSKKMMHLQILQVVNESQCWQQAGGETCASEQKSDDASWGMKRP